MDLLLQSIERSVRRHRLHVHDEIDGTEILATRPAAKDLSDPPLDTVAHHGLLGNLAADRDAQTCFSARPRTGDALSSRVMMHRDQRSVSSPTSSVAGQEVGSMSKPLFGPKTLVGSR